MRRAGNAKAALVSAALRRTFTPQAATSGRLTVTKEGSLGREIHRDHKGIDPQQPRLRILASARDPTPLAA